MKSTKMIKVTSRGYVMTSRGRVLAPIRTPYRESVSKIWSMITSDRADVWEKLPNGEFIQLTPLNFDKDNSKKEVKKVEENKSVEKVAEPVVKTEEVTKPINTEVREDIIKVVDTSEETTPVSEASEEKVEETEEVKEEPVVNNNQNKNGYNKFDKKNKHNRPNNNKVNAASIAVTPEEV